VNPRKGPVFEEFDQVIQTHMKSVERLLELVRIPDIHDHILLEQVFDCNQIRQENKGIRRTRHDNR
jgi:hypothetical protein